MSNPRTKFNVGGRWRDPRPCRQRSHGAPRHHVRCKALSRGENIISFCTSHHITSNFRQILVKGSTVQAGENGNLDEGTWLDKVTTGLSINLEESKMRSLQSLLQLTVGVWL